MLAFHVAQLYKFLLNCISNVIFRFHTLPKFVRFRLQNCASFIRICERIPYRNVTEIVTECALAGDLKKGINFFGDSV